MSNNLLITLAIVGLILVSGFAWAKHKGYGPGGDRMQHVSEWVSYKLDLNDQQKSELSQFTDKLSELRGSWKQQRTQMSGTVEELLAAPTLDRERVMQLLDERQQAMAAHKGEVVDAFAEFSDSLQPEQRTRLAQIISDRLEHKRGCDRRRNAN